MNDSENKNKKCILCIDDDQAMHTLLQTQIATSGYRSVHAMNAMEALQTLKKQRVDLIILDINMPDMDGFQLLNQLKMNTETQQIPVIFLSSLSRENLKVKGLERGADDFIVKPFTGPELLARIKAVLRRQEPQKGSTGDVHGNIEDLGLFELLHMLSFSHKSAVITFPEMQGELVVANGVVLSARQGLQSDKEALLRLFFLEKGVFTIVYEERDGEGIGGIESLLLFIGSAMDEIKAQLESLAPAGATVMLVQDVQDLPEIQEIQESFPLSLEELLFALPGDLQTNVSRVEHLLTQGILAIADE